MKKALVIVVIFGIFILMLFGVIYKCASNEVLDSFGKINEKLDKANAETQRKQDSLRLRLKNSDYTSLGVKAKVFDSISKNFENYLETLKTELLGETAASDFEAMDRNVDALLFNGETPSEKGQELLNNLRAYRDFASNAFQEIDSEHASVLKYRFDTSIVNDHSASQATWLKSQFKGFPLVVTITKITQIQQDVKTTQQEFLSKILSEEKQP